MVCCACFDRSLEGGAGGAGFTHFMQGRIRMTIDPLRAYNTGTGHVGFN